MDISSVANNMLEASGHVQGKAAKGFDDALKHAESLTRKEPDKKPPEVAAEKSGPPQNKPSPPPDDPKKAADSTGEVKPIEPNAQANEPDSQSNLKESVATVAVVALASVATVTKVSVVAQDPVDNLSQKLAKPADSQSSPNAEQAPLMALAVDPNAPKTSDAQIIPQDVKTPIVSVTKTNTIDAPKNGILLTQDQANQGKVAVTEVRKPEVTAKTADATPLLIEAEASETGGSASGNEQAPSNPNHHDSHKPSGEIVPTEAQLAPTSQTVEQPKEVDNQAKINRDLLTRQLTDRIELLAAARPKGGIVVNLQPADLGSITLILSGDKANLQAHIMSDNEKVREAIQQAHPAMTQQLGQRGVNLTQLAVSNQDSASSSRSSTDSHKQSGNPNQDQPRQSQHFSSAGQPGQNQLSSLPSTRKLSTSGIDLSI